MTLHTTQMRLPMTLDEVDAEWLTLALSQRFPGIEIATVTRSAERSGTSTSACFALTYASSGGHADLPASVYVKGGFDEVMRRRVWAALIQEPRFYAEWAPEVPANIPLAYFAGIDAEAKQGVLILEDMYTRGVRFGNIMDPIPVDTVYLTIENIAKLHGRFWRDPRLPAYQGWAEPMRTFMLYQFRQKNWDDVIQRSYGGLLLDIFATPEAAREALHRMWALNDARPRTLVHGDCHSGQLYYEPDGRPGIMDWQCVFPGWLAHDLGENLLTSLTIEDRRRHERDIIKHYLSVARASGIGDEAPSFDELFLTYRQNLMHMMASATMGLYDMQSVEVTDTSAYRTLAAVKELDSLGALGLR